MTPRPRLLIVEDDSAIATVLRLRLKAAGYDVEIARDGRAGLQAAIESPPNAMLLDIRLPHMDGLTVLKEMRLMARTRDVPVIVISANATGKNKQKALDLGASFFLEKPYESTRLLLFVHTVLADGRTKDQMYQRAQETGES